LLSYKATKKDINHAYEYGNYLNSATAIKLKKKKKGGTFWGPVNTNITYLAFDASL